MILQFFRIEYSNEKDRKPVFWKEEDQKANSANWLFRSFL